MFHSELPERATGSSDKPEKIIREVAAFYHSAEGDCINVLSLDSSLILCKCVFFLSFVRQYKKTVGNLPIRDQTRPRFGRTMCLECFFHPRLKKMYKNASSYMSPYVFFSRKSLKDLMKIGAMMEEERTQRREKKKGNERDWMCLL